MLEDTLTNGLNDPKVQDSKDLGAIPTVEDVDPSLSSSEKPKKARQVSIAEYMFKNIHLLGFENNTRVINVAIRELMDNALDAANQSSILPQVCINLESQGKKSYKMSFLDFGPGIEPEDVPNTCCRLLYGSKFSDNIAQRGQQGLGLTALILYSQKTRGKPVRIRSKTKDSVEVEFLLEINIKTNRPNVVKKTIVKQDMYFEEKGSGFFVELVFEAAYTKKGPKATTSLLQQYCYLNPTLNLDYHGPDETLKVERVSYTIPRIGRRVKEVPHHITIGELQKIIEENQHLTFYELLRDLFEGPLEKHQELLNQLGIPSNLKCNVLDFNKLEQMIATFKELYQDIKPDPLCLIDLGPSIIKTVTRDYTISFDNILNVTSEPIYYEKGVLKVEACAFYGSPSLSKDQKILLYRVANGTPLLYQAPSCCLTKSVIDYNWKDTGLSQVENELPRGNLILFLHINSTKNPFITESKDAIADLPNIRACVNSCLQKLSKQIRSYMKKEDYYKTLLQKKIIIGRVLPDLIKTIEAGLKRKVENFNYRKLHAEILELVCFFKGPQSLYCYNGSKTYKRFSLKVDQDWLKVDMKPKDSFTLETKSLLQVEGITPVEYLQFKEK